MARQSRCLLLLRHADLHAIAITKLEPIAILLRLIVYDPELLKVLVVTCALKTKRFLSRKSGIGRAVCKTKVLAPSRKLEMKDRTRIFCQRVAIARVLEAAIRGPRMAGSGKRQNVGQHDGECVV